MVGIYKITNQLNNKAYIGQSVHIERRWKEHIQQNNNSNIYQAIVKYGIDNFKFEILEECDITELNQKEIYYIQKYNTISPFGYNITTGGQQSNENFNYIDKQKVDDIINDLLNTNDSIVEITKKYNISFQAVDDIRLGNYHKKEGLSYPLRAKKSIKIYDKHCLICGKPIYKESNYCVECFHLQQRQVERPSKEYLFELIKTKTFVEIGKMYGVTDNAIRSWCKTYGLPSTKKELKQLNLI